MKPDALKRSGLYNNTKKHTPEITTNEKHQISLWTDQIKVQSAEQRQQERKVQQQKTSTRGKENIKKQNQTRKSETHSTKGQ